MDFSIIDLHP